MCGPGDCRTALVMTWLTWRRTSIRSSVVGCSTTVPSTGQRSTHCCHASTPTWCVGSARSTNGFGRRRRPSGVGAGSSNDARACSRTGPGFLPCPLSGDQDDKSPVTGDCYAGICGSPGLKCPGLPDREECVQERAAERRARTSAASGAPWPVSRYGDDDLSAGVSLLHAAQALGRVGERVCPV